MCCHLVQLLLYAMPCMHITKGCTYVLHVASPFPASAPKNVDDLVVPAREGTLRALRAAKEAGSVKRVVITSSLAAIGMFRLCKRIECVDPH